MHVIDQQAKCYSIEAVLKAEQICGVIGWEGETTPLLNVGIIYMLSFKIQ